MARELTPWGRGETRQLGFGREREESPFFAFRRELDRLFDDAFRGWNVPAAGGGTGTGWPHLEVKETDNEIKIAAELPGLTEKDIELSMDEGMLTIRGERQQERDDKARGYSERYYGRFERRLALPRGVEQDKADARFENGLLTVTLPKGPEAERARRIPINAATRH
jgi:HSP20 family protein